MKNQLCEGGGPLPLVVAVTGHRDLLGEDEPGLRRQIEAVLLHLANLHPFTRLRLLCGLAEGADRLVAKVALDFFAKHQRGDELVACLPMERSLYETDFETAESKREFEELLHRAQAVISLPLVKGSNRASVEKPGPERDLQYAALGSYLVKHCQVLLALWDGEATALMGGTSSVVDLQLGTLRGDLGFDPKHPLDGVENGPVYWIPTRRLKSPSRPREEQWQLLHGVNDRDQDQSRKVSARITRRMDAFNKDVIRKAALLTKGRPQSRKYLLPEEEQRPFLGTALETIIDHYVTADLLAQYYQGRTRRSFQVLIFVCGLSGLFLLELFGHGPEGIQSVALLAYLVVILFAYVWYRLATRRELKTRHLDYRALAEGLRLQFFWSLAGVRKEAADHYLAKQKTELDWIRHAIRLWSEPLSQIDIAPRLDLVRQHWVDGQRNFFQRAAGMNDERHQQEKGWTRVLLLGLVAIALVAAGAAVYEWVAGASEFPDLPAWFSSHRFLEMDLHGALLILMSMLPAVAAAIVAYSLKMAITEQRRQYHRMYRLYDRAANRLDQAVRHNRADAVEKIFLDLGLEALTENGDWVLLHRERKIEMPLS